jgi:4-hydroxybenzoate polyprenyltransferase
MMDSVRDRVNSFLELTRWNEWGDSKLPFIFLAYLLVAVKNPTSTVDSTILWGNLGFSCFYLAFGYLCNDWMDRETDRMAGKLKRVQQWSFWHAMGLLSFFAIASMFFILSWIHSTIALIIIGLCYLLAITYSGTFLRFKERGWAGLIVASLAQRTLPASLVFAAFGIWDHTVVLFLILTILIGVRWMVTHQVDDLERDRATSTNTFAIHQNQKILNRLLVWLLNLEILNLLILAFSVASPVLPWIYGVYFGISCFMSFTTHTTPWQMLKTPATAYLVLADFYFLYWPLGMVIWLGVIQFPYWWLIAVSLVILLRHHIQQHLSDLFLISNRFKKDL